MPPRLERCDPQKNGGRFWRQVDEPKLPDPLSLCRDGRDRSMDWLCRQLAGGDPVMHDRLFYRTDLVRVMEQYGYWKAERIVERQSANLEVMRTANG